MKAIQDSKKKNPKLWQLKFRVGDAVEIMMVSQGGVNSTELERNRGVIQGIFRKGLDHSIMIRDIVMGEPVERTIPLHSPLIRSMKILEKNFIFKGKRKVKRAKLYYLRDLNPLRKFSILIEHFHIRKLVFLTKIFLFSFSYASLEGVNTFYFS